MAKSLDACQARRDATGTTAPQAQDRPLPAPHLRFVIQKQDASRLHYDLRLEVDGVFKSWAVMRGPSLDPGEKRLAVELEDYPLEYGDFEGTIPKSEQGSGTVMVWDRGYWAPQAETSPEKCLRDGELKLVLAGHKMKGGWTLVRLKTRRGEERPHWVLIKDRDRWATPGRDEILGNNRSVASGRAMADIASRKGRPPEPFLTTDSTAGPRTVWNVTTKERTGRRAVAELVAKSPSKAIALPKITTSDRVLWPDVGITKRQLADYLLAVAPWMIEHVYGRPCSLLRAPDGISGATLFQRHVLSGEEALAAAVRVHDGHEPYLQIDDAQTLVSMAQVSAIELHPWNSAPFQPLVPGRLVFDIHPAPDVPLQAVIEAAFELRRRLSALGLVPFCKTTGGNGLHVVTPLKPDPGTSWPQAMRASQTICEQMACDRPDRYVTTITKKVRKGRIFLDYLRNDFMATTVSPLSPRARRGAPVSMPLTWHQVGKGLDPRRFTIATVPDLLARSGAWQGYAESARPLEDALRKLEGGE